MVRKSYGKMRKSRNKLSGKKASGIGSYIRKFSPGDAVHVDFLPSSKLPHPRFQGSTGKVMAKRGKSYMVQITDHNATKTLFLRPEHLKPQKGNKEQQKNEDSILGEAKLLRDSKKLRFLRK